jgi:hypothetical protein
MEITTIYSAFEKKAQQRDIQIVFDFIKGKNNELSADDNFCLKNHVEEIRKITSEIKKEKNAQKLEKLKKSKDFLKKQLPCLLPSMKPTDTCIGNTFIHHIDNFYKHTFLFHLDFDGLSDIELEKLIGILKKDKRIYFFFKSPSGGIKAFYLFNPIDKDLKFMTNLHLILFNHFEKSFRNKGFIIDQSCKNINRLCFLSYDPDIYINRNIKINDIPDSVLNETIKQISKSEIMSYKLQSKSEGGDAILDEMLDWIKLNTASYLSIYDSYDMWFKLCNVLIKRLQNPIKANDYIHKFSAFSPKYDSNAVDKKIENLLKTHDSSKTSSINLVCSELSRFGFSFKLKKDNEVLLSPSNKDDIPFMLESLGIKLISDKWTRITKLMIKNVVTEPDQEYLNMCYNLVRETYSNKLNKSDIKEYLNDKRYMLIEEKFISLLEEEKTEDETHYEKFISSLKTNNDDALVMCLMRWIFGVFDNLLTEDYFKYIFVFKGKSNVGKTYVIKKLLSPFKRYSTSDFNWDEKNKDNLSMLTTNIFIVDDELVATTKANIESIKSITSKTFCKYREPYAERFTDRKRIATFIGSANTDKFFKDDTGAARFISFELQDVDRELLKEVDFKKLWGYAWYLYNKPVNKQTSDTRIEMTSRELVDEEFLTYIEQLNEESREISVEEDLITDLYEDSDTADTKATTILLKLQNEFKIRTNSSILGKILKRKNIKSKRKNNGVYYYIKLKETPFDTEITESEIDEKLRENSENTNKLLDLKSKIKNKHNI